MPFVGGEYVSSRGKDDWLGDPELIKFLGPFDLDPCCPEKMPWRTAKTMYTRRECGLKTPWKKNEIVWLNPPRAWAMSYWLEKLVKHDNGIAMIPPKTEQKWFHKYIWQRARVIYFPNFRFTCYHMVNLEKVYRPSPTILVAYGNEAALRVSRMPKEKGHLINNAINILT